MSRPFGTLGALGLYLSRKSANYFYEEKSLASPQLLFLPHGAKFGLFKGSISKPKESCISWISWKPCKFWFDLTQVPNVNKYPF